MSGSNVSASSPSSLRLTAITSPLTSPKSSLLLFAGDPDSACITATASISSHITKPPFTSILKPIIEALVTEQDHNSQIGSALCLASVIDGSPDPDLVYLRRLLPRVEKLLKSESFKAKPALMKVIGSVISVGVASSQQVVKNLVQCLVKFVTSEDLAAKKTAAEALVKLAMVERDMLSEFKAPCLKTFEAKRFDKVKIVRETMNQPLEAWKEIPDAADEVSPPHQTRRIVVQRFMEVNLLGEEWFWDGKGKRWGGGVKVIEMLDREMTIVEVVRGDDGGGGPNVMKQRERDGGRGK